VTPSFDRTLARLARLTDLDVPWQWLPKARADARYALYHALEAEQAAAVAAPTVASESARILELAQVAFGRLRGLLAGVDDELLDRAPAAGEWALRQTLTHAIAVERSYRANTELALARGDADPLSLPADHDAVVRTAAGEHRRPRPDPADTSGGVLDIVEAFAKRRAETDAALSDLTSTQMTRPSRWGALDDSSVIDVRFRLHRFASHIAEHTVQCETTVAQLGVPLTDARVIVRAIGAARGAHERRSPSATLDALDAALHAKADAIGM
jgi:hypothetical protein